MYTRACYKLPQVIDRGTKTVCGRPVMQQRVFTVLVQAVPNKYIHTSVSNSDLWDFYSGSTILGGNSQCICPQSVISELIHRQRENYKFVSQRETATTICNLCVGRENVKVFLTNNYIRKPAFYPADFVTLTVIFDLILQYKQVRRYIISDLYVFLLHGW